MVDLVKYALYAAFCYTGKCNINVRISYGIKYIIKFKFIDFTFLLCYIFRIMNVTEAEVLQILEELASRGLVKRMEDQKGWTRRVQMDEATAAGGIGKYLRSLEE